LQRNPLKELLATRWAHGDFEKICRSIGLGNAEALNTSELDRKAAVVRPLTVIRIKRTRASGRRLPPWLIALLALSQIRQRQRRARGAR